MGGIMGARVFLAFDLGAESGRAILGSLQGGHLSVTQLQRFANQMVNLRGHLHWNLAQIFQEVKAGMGLCAAEFAAAPDGIAVDTWGVDFGLLGPDGSLLGLPYCYRDARTEGAMEQFFQRVPRRRLYELTGIQFLPFNSLFQLFAMVRDNSPLLQIASDLLFMPDLFDYLLTGERKTEFTFATTSQLYNPVKGDWEDELFQALGVPRGIMQQIVPPGTVIGRLSKQICEETGLQETPVIATASHDTAAAVAAAPGEGKDWAYISSGTWSLMGVESPTPVIGEESLELNFTNEGGVGGTFRVLKNIAGLWLVRQCRKAWESQRGYSYEELTSMASGAPPFRAVIEPDHGAFLNPPDMPEAIRRFCQRTKQPAPETPAQFVRCILESLALKYRMVLDQLRQIYEEPINRIHIVGGGARNDLLCQFTANAADLPVIAGPAEATAIGNLLTQALGLGYVESLVEIREIVRRSFPLKRYEPEQTAEWQAAYSRFQELSRGSREG